MENNSNTTCTDKYDNSTFHGLMYFRCTLSIISVVCILSMLAIIVLFKKYRFFTQRLVLYLAISTLTYQIISAADTTSISAYKSQAAMNYCIFIGFMSQIVVWWPVLATTVIVFDMFVRVVLEKPTESFEIPYLLTIFTPSIIVGWIPFIGSSFGPSQYFCWIRAENMDANCTMYTQGVILRFVLYIAPYYLLVTLMTITLVITLFFLHRWTKIYRGKFDPQAVALRRRMKEEIMPIVYYPILFITVGLVSVVAISFNALKSQNTMVYVIISVILSISHRLLGVFITLVFTLDPETRVKLNRKDFLAAIRSFCEKDHATNYDARYNTRSDSLYYPADNTIDDINNSS